MRRDYTVFIDESFDGFMGLSNPKGYFCYAALMLPTETLGDLERFWVARRARLVNDYALATGFSLRDAEFKSSYLKRLTLSARRNFAERFAKFLRRNDGYICGFYTTVDTYALYNLRTAIGRDDDDARFLPDDWADRLGEVKEKLLRKDEKSPGAAALLMGQLHATLEMALNWLGSQGHSFEVVYDPREKKEDAFLLGHVGGWLGDEKAAIKRFPGAYRGANATLRSELSPGLMLCDLVVRDVRMLFADLPGLVEEGSSNELIVPFPQKDIPYIIEIAGTPLKGGHLRPMSESLRRQIQCPTPNSMMPLYLDRLANGKLSCTAIWGEMRSISFQNHLFEDMID